MFHNLLKIFKIKITCKLRNQMNELIYRVFIHSVENKVIQSKNNINFLYESLTPNENKSLGLYFSQFILKHILFLLKNDSIIDVSTYEESIEVRFFFVIMYVKISIKMYLNSKKNLYFSF